MFPNDNTINSHHHQNTLQPIQPSLNTQEDEFDFVYQDEEDPQNDESHQFLKEPSPNSLQLINVLHKQSSSTDEDHKRLSYTSFVSLRKSGVRRSSTNKDTPSHFQHAQDVSLEYHSNHQRGTNNNIDNLKLIRNNNASIISQSISKRNSLLKMGSIVEQPDNAINQEAYLAHASLFNGSNRSSRIFEQSNTHRKHEVISEITENKGPVMRGEIRAEHIKIQSLKELLRLFRVNMFNGQSYKLDIADNQSPPKAINESKNELNQVANEYFAGVDSQVGTTINTLQIDNRMTFANVITQFQQKQSLQSSNGRGFEQNLNIPYKNTSNLSINLDQMLLSSPTHQNNPLPSFANAFQDKEIQVDLFLDRRTVSTNQEEQLTINKEKSTEIQEIPLQQQVYVENQVEALPPSPDYYLEIQKKCALEVEAQEQLDFSHSRQKSANDVAFPLHQNHQRLGEMVMKSQILNNSPELQLLFSNSSKLNEMSLGLRRTHSLAVNQEVKSANVNAILTQIQSENEKLKQQNDQFKKQLSNVYIGGGERNLSDAQLHLAFMFATPLVVKRGNLQTECFKELYKIQPLLEFKKEFNEIKRSLKETKRGIKFRSMQATIDNFSMILAKNPLALHFSGHGLENRSTNSTNSLLLEYEDGEGEEVSEKQLIDIVRTSNSDLEFVFVASCYSEFAGKIFLNAGARHVICVKSGNTIADEAVIVFSKSFYHSVFCQNMTICDSFNMAKKQCEVRYGPYEASKFSILKRTESFGQVANGNTPPPSKPKPKKKLRGMPVIDDEEEEFKVELPPPVHTCKIFGPFNQGEVQSLDEKYKVIEIPSPVENLIGRQIEIFEVVHNVLHHRLVNIIGLPGIGKTALAKNAVNYISDRHLFKQGIIFFSCKGYKNCGVFVKKLVTNIMLSNVALDKEEQNQINSGNVELMLRMIINHFKDIEDQVLVVFDNAEDLLYHDRQAFRELITDLLDHCNCMTFLITSRIVVGVLQDIQEKIIVLQELSPGYSVDLLLSRARVIEEEEKLELVKSETEGEILLCQDANLSNQSQKVNNLAKHHLFKILAGNPHAIILAAPLLLNKRLIDLYRLLNSEKLLEVLKVDGVTDSTVASLCLSLEASMIMLQKEDEVTLAFFYLIGLLPGGIFKNELHHIWRQNNQSEGHEYHIEKLMKLSLIQDKEQAGDKHDSKLTLPPFINNYAEQTIDPILKQEFQSNLCQYYTKILRDLYKDDFRDWCNQNDQYSTDIIVTQNRMKTEQEFIKLQREKLIRHETNIWACVYRMAKSDKPIEKEMVQLKDQIPQNRSSRFSTPTNKKSHSTVMNKQSQKKVIRRSNEPLKEVIEEERDDKSDISDNLKGTTKQAQNKNNNQDDQKSNQSSMHTDEEFEQDNYKSIENPQDAKGFPTIKNKLKVKKASTFQNQNSTDLNKKEIGFIEEEKREDNHPFQPSDEKSDDHSATPNIGSNIIMGLKKHFDQKITKIMRDSIVKFAFNRPSVRHSLSLDNKDHNSVGDSLIDPSEPLKLVEVKEEDDPYKPRQFHSQYFMSINPLHAHNSLGESRGVMHLNNNEKLIIYYGYNLYLLRDDDSALKLINGYALEFCKGSNLYMGNIHRLLGLIHLRKVEIKEAQESFKQAQYYFQQANSTYGLALCKFSLGFMYKSNFSELLNEDSTKENLKNALQFLTDSLNLFKPLNHIVGLARCHEHLSVIKKKVGNIKEFEDHQRESCNLSSLYIKYQAKYKHRSPHIQTIYGQDLSLMCEIVIDSENRNLFQEISKIITPTNVGGRTPRSENNTVKIQKGLSTRINEDSKSESPQLVLSHQVSAPPLNLLGSLSINKQDFYQTPQPQYGKTELQSLQSQLNLKQGSQSSTISQNFSTFQQEDENQESKTLSKEETKANESPNKFVIKMGQGILKQSLSKVTINRHNKVNEQQKQSNNSAPPKINQELTQVPQKMDIVAEEEDAAAFLDTSVNLIDDNQDSQIKNTPNRLLQSPRMIKKPQIMPSHHTSFQSIKLKTSRSPILVQIKDQKLRTINLKHEQLESQMNSSNIEKTKGLQPEFDNKMENEQFVEMLGKTLEIEGIKRMLSREYVKERANASV